jgi:hypothetical protein
MLQLPLFVPLTVMDRKQENLTIARRFSPGNVSVHPPTASKGRAQVRNSKGIACIGRKHLTS